MIRFNEKKTEKTSTAEHYPKQMKLLFIKAPMMSQCDSIADSHSQHQSETITAMSGSHSESSGTQKSFLKMQWSHLTLNIKISDITCDCVAFAVVAGSMSESCDDKFERQSICSRYRT